MGCKIATLPRSGKLALRLHWVLTGAGVYRTQEQTGLSDKKQHRELLARDFVGPIEALMNARRFDRAAYLYYFPSGSRAADFRRDLNLPLGAPDVAAAADTVLDYYERWLGRKKEPHVRRTRIRDYKQHFTRYILPVIGGKALHALTLDDLIRVRDMATAEDLAPKTVRNILLSSLKAMLHEALREELSQAYLLFPSLELAPNDGFVPDPFSFDEREKLLAHYAALGSGVHFPFPLTLALTGMRPSEATGLHVGDLDVPRSLASIQRSRVDGVEYAMPKTKKSRRTIRLHPAVVEALAPLVAGADPDRPLFLNLHGKPLQQENWRSDYWATALTACGLRHRDMYALRDTFISLVLSEGASVIAVANYCGTSIAMIDQSYGKYMPRDERGLTLFIKPPSEAVTGCRFRPGETSETDPEQHPKG
jgi:integrase